MPTGVTFSIPANNGSAGHPATQTSLFLFVPSAPGADVTIFDYDLSSGDYFRLRLASTLHLWLEYRKSVYGAATVDLGAIPTSTWTWITCGFKTSGGLSLRGDMTPSGGATSTATALASSGAASGTTLTDVPFGVGLSLTSSDADFPNDVAGNWLCSKLIQTQIASNAAAGNPEPMPTTDVLAHAFYRAYVAHDALGAAATLTDSGTAALNLLAGSAGLTIADAGPALVPSSPGPGAAHEGDLSYYHSGSWQTLHIGTSGQVLTVAGGDPAWASPSGGVTSIAVSAPATFTVSGSPITSSGTIVLAWATQSAGRVLAGPGSGPAAAPTFRSLVSGDLPVATASAVGATKPGTGLSVAGDGTLSLVPGASLPSGAEGDLLVYSGGAWIPLAPGTTGQFLRMAGGYPAWGESMAPLTDSTGAIVTDSAGNIIMA